MGILSAELAPSAHTTRKPQHKRPKKPEMGACGPQAVVFVD